MITAEFLQAFDSELFAVPVESVGDAVGAKEHGIARAASRTVRDS